MLEILTGVVSGIVSGTGIGGGTILILVLSAFMGINQHTAQGVNLVFFIPTSISSIITCIKEKLIDWKVGTPIASAGVVGAIIGAKISSNLEVNRLKKYFGVYLGVIAIYETYNIFKLYILKRNPNNIKEK